jgi:3-(3-hydroxy-phenyl)propionate hydroxylase
MFEGTAARHVAVVIVGAGPTGLVAANLLGQQGIETLVLESHTSTSAIPRAITLDDEGLRICQAIGLYEELCADMLLDVQAHYVSRGRLLARVAPRGRDNGHPFVSTLHQPTFEATLLHGLERFPCIEVRFQHTVTAIAQYAHSVHLTVQCPNGIDQNLTCDYLLACDGGKSTIRQFAVPSSFAVPLSGSRKRACFPPPSEGKYIAWNLKKSSRNVSDTSMRILSGSFFVPVSRRQARNSQRWLVVDGKEGGEHEPGDHEGRPYNDTARARPDGNERDAITFFCTPARPAVTVPAPGQRRRWEFMLLPGEQEEDILQWDISELIKQATGQDETTYSLHITRRAVYTFHAMLAREWTCGRIFLLGDAAHLMPPFGGQGMNSGLRDASNLCWKLALVLHGQAHSGILATYSQERLPHAAQMIRFSAALGALIMPTSPLIAYARDIFFHTINHIAPLRRVLAEAQVKPRSRYRQGLLLTTNNGIRKRLIGTLLPQPHITLVNGDHILLDDILNAHFALLRLTATPSTAYTSLNAQVWQRWAVRFVCIVPRGREIPDEAMDGSMTAPLIVRDDENVLNARLFHDNEVLCLLVRPDRYIMGAFLIQNSQAFEQALTRLLQTSARPAADDRVPPGV